MTIHFEDALDSCLDRVRAGEPATAVLQDYPEQANDLAPLLAAAAPLETVLPVTSPSPENLLADRSNFLEQLAQLPEPVVSPSPFIRLKEWLVPALPWLETYPNSNKREQRKMSTLLLKAVLVFTILAGSVGGTAVMASESLPDSPLYPAKLAYEEARLTYATDDAARAVVHLELAAARLRETERLMTAGQMPPDTLLNRAEAHIEAAFGLAAEMPQPLMAGVLVQAQEMIQTRTRTLAQMQAPPEMEPIMTQAQTMLKNAGETAAAGLQDPQLLRQRHMVNRPEELPAPPEMQPPMTTIITPTQPITTPVRAGGPCQNNEDCDPVGDGPYGPAYNGPGPNEEPGERHGAGPGVGYPGPAEPPAQNGPGEPNGNQDGGCPDCGNEGNQNGYGPRPEETGNGDGDPGGSSNGIPIGGQNQNGPQYQAPDTSGPPTADTNESNNSDNQNNSGSNK